MLLVLNTCGSNEPTAWKQVQVLHVLVYHTHQLTIATDDDTLKNVVSAAYLNYA